TGRAAHAGAPAARAIALEVRLGASIHARRQRHAHAPCRHVLAMAPHGRDRRRGPGVSALPARRDARAVHRLGRWRVDQARVLSSAGCAEEPARRLASLRVGRRDAARGRRDVGAALAMALWGGCDAERSRRRIWLPHDDVPRPAGARDQLRRSRLRFLPLCQLLRPGRRRPERRRAVANTSARLYSPWTLVSAREQQGEEGRRGRPRARPREGTGIAPTEACLRWPRTPPSLQDWARLPGARFRLVPTRK